MKNTCGTTFFEGKEYKLLQSAYPEDCTNRYKALVEDEEGKECYVYWDIIATPNDEGWYECEEDEMCDWDEADEVEYI